MDGCGGGFYDYYAFDDEIHKNNRLTYKGHPHSSRSYLMAFAFTRYNGCELVVLHYRWFVGWLVGWWVGGSIIDDVVLGQFFLVLLVLAYFMQSPSACSLVQVERARGRRLRNSVCGVFIFLLLLYVLLLLLLVQLCLAH